jgi:hypothetical protein
MASIETGISPSQATLAARVASGRRRRHAPGVADTLTAPAPTIEIAITGALPR